MNPSFHFVSPLSRRSFLAGSALLLGAAALDGLEVRTLPVKNTGFPRGKARNLLARPCSPQALAASLLPIEKYHPWPRIGDPAWSELRPHTRAHQRRPRRQLGPEVYRPLLKTKFPAIAGETRVVFYPSA